MNTTNNIATATTIARANADLLSYLKGAQVGAEIMRINLRGAADIDDQMAPMDFVVENIHRLLGELIEDLVERMDADQEVEDSIAVANALQRAFDGEVLPKSPEDQAIEDWGAQESDRQEYEDFLIAEASMREAAGAAVMEAVNDREMGWDTRKNPGAFSEALASDSDELASEEAARLKAADEAEQERLMVEPLVDAGLDHLYEKAKEATQPQGFVLDVLWIGRGDPTKEELDQLVEGNLGAVSAKVATVPPHYFEDNPNDFVEAACKEACSWDHDIIAGDFSADQALQLGIAVAQDDEPYGVRFAVRKDGGGFRIFMV